MNKELFNENIKKSIDALNNGEIILYPTDTVWGLGCDATNTKAVKKIFDLKKRNEAKSLIVIVNSDRMLQQFVEDVPELAWDIMDLSNKPTTIIYPNAKNLAENVVAHDGSIAIRMIKEGFCFHRGSGWDSGCLQGLHAGILPEFHVRRLRRGLLC